MDKFLVFKRLGFFQSSDGVWANLKKASDIFSKGKASGSRCW